MCNTSAPCLPPGTCPQECIAQTHGRTPPTPPQPREPLGREDTRGTQGHGWGHMELGPVQAWGRKAIREMATSASARRWLPCCDSPRAASPMESGCHRRCDIWGRGGRVPTPCPRGNLSATAAATISGRAHAPSAVTSPLLLCHPLDPLCHRVTVAVSPQHDATVPGSARAAELRQRSGSHPAPPRPTPAPGPPQSGAGGVGGGGWICFTHREARTRESKPFAYSASGAAAAPGGIAGTACVRSQRGAGRRGK